MNSRSSTRRTRDWVHMMALASVLGHVFCCGLPIILGIVSLLAGAGVLSPQIPGLDNFHNIIHSHELALLGFSLAMLVAGWGLQLHAARVDCHETGCQHPPCDSKKHNASSLLWVATAVFAFNVCFMVFLPHKGQGPAITAVHEVHHKGH